MNGGALFHLVYFHGDNHRSLDSWGQVHRKAELTPVFSAKSALNCIPEEGICIPILRHYLRFFRNKPA